MANEFVQTMSDARIDARSLSDFVFKPSGFKVPRRLAPPIDTLQFYIDRFDATKATTDAYVATIPNIVNDAINNTAVEGGVLADTFVTATANNGTVPRSQREINSEHVSVKSYGAIGDGTLHTVSEWTVIGSRIYYPNLEAIQVDYPHVTSLTDSIDWAATQKAVFNAAKVYCPKGKYVTNKVIKTPHDITPRNIGLSAKGLDIYGDGTQTVFTRNNEVECTRQFNAEGTSTTQESDTANSLEAIFAVHCPYTNIFKMSLESSALGVYLGQDFDQPFTSLSSTSHSTFEDLQINRCGTGILCLAAGGNHYIGLRNIAFNGCQIDYHCRSSFWWKITQGRGDANNNRHVFVKIRSGSSRIGYWNECGDTHTGYSWHSEGGGSANTVCPYPVAHHLPPQMVKTASAFVFSGSNQLNRFINCNTEGIEWALHNDGYNNTFISNGFKEAESTFVQKPRTWIGSFSTSFGGIIHSDNSYPELYPEAPQGGSLYIGVASPNGTKVVSDDLYHAPSSNINKSESRKFQIEFGAVAKETELVIDLWPDAVTEVNKVANFNIDVVSRCITSGQTSSFSAKATVSALRNAVRTVNHYSIHVSHSFRSYYDRHLVNVYEMVGEPSVKTETTSQAMRLSVRPKPTNSKSLQLVITCPWDLSGGTIFVEKQTQRLGS